MARLFSALAVALLLSVWAAGDPAPAADRQTVEIATAGGTRRISVELAATPQAIGRGLMFRKHLPDGHGMLFDFGPERRIDMWMKNTLIPLDMIFIGADGRIRQIAENTKPLSTRLISSSGPARAVLEINAGAARKLGIAVGDRVSHTIFAAGAR
jgi:uncharacterized membrane protein (UPF0127 family)